MESKGYKTYQNSRMLKHATMVFTFLLGQVQSYCFDDRLKVRSDFPSVTITMGGWDSQIIINMIGFILLNEKMGVDTNWYPTDIAADYWDYDVDYPEGYTNWFKAGSIDVAFSMGHYHIIYMKDMLYDGSLVSKKIGVKETVGFFYPQYMSDEWNGLHWRSLKTNTMIRDRLIQDSSSDFPTSLPPIYGSRPNYEMSKWGVQCNVALDLNINYTLTGSDANLRDLVNTMYPANKAFVIHHYTPTLEFAKYDLERMALPFNPSGEDSDACHIEFRCEWFDDGLEVVATKIIAEEAPEVMDFVRRIHLDRGQVNNIIKIYHDMAKVPADNLYSDWEAAVCAWLKKNEEVWINWIIQIPPRTPFWLIVIQWTAIGIAFMILWFLGWKLWKMTDIKSKQGQQASKLKMKSLKIEFLMHMGYIFMDLGDVATDIWAVGTIFTIKGATMLLAMCYVVSLVTALAYTAFMYHQRIKFIFQIKREMVGDVAKSMSKLKELKRRWLNEVLLLLSGIFEDIPSIVLNVYVYYMGLRKTVFMLSLFFSLICLGVKSSAIEKMSIYRAQISAMAEGDVGAKYICAVDRSKSL